MLDHRRQPGIAHVEPGGAPELAAVSRRRTCRCASFIRPASRCSKRSRAAFANPDWRAKWCRSSRTCPRLCAGRPGGCRSGAGAVAELAAAGKPSILLPFPFAADQHQLRNAEAFVRAGAALLALDREMTGEKLFEIVRAWRPTPPHWRDGRTRRASLAHPGAARRAAEIWRKSQMSTTRAESAVFH